MRRETYLYACKIKETTNGRWRGARGEARKALEVVAQRRFARNVQIDEQSGAAQNGQDQAQRKTDKEEAALRNASWRLLSVDRLFALSAMTCLNGSALTLLVPVKG